MWTIVVFPWSVTIDNTAKPPINFCQNHLVEVCLNEVYVTKLLKIGRRGAKHEDIIIYTVFGDWVKISFQTGTMHLFDTRPRHTVLSLQELFR